MDGNDCDGLRGVVACREVACGVGKGAAEVSERLAGDGLDEALPATNKLNKRRIIWKI